MPRKVRLLAASVAELWAMPPAAKRAMREALRSLGDDPSGRSRLLDVKQLDLRSADPPIYRLRVGEWRAAFVVEAREIRVVRIFARSDGYRWLDTFDL